MAKYCDKCGKALPDGVEICPDCNAPAGGADAALFTRITAETEVWKGSEGKKQRLKKTRSQKEKTAYIGAGILVAAFLIFAIVFTRPALRVVRAVNQGKYDEALEIYWGTEKLQDDRRIPMIDKAILKAADGLCSRFAAQEIDADTAAEALSKLGTLGEGAETLLNEHFSDFLDLCKSQEHFEEGEKLFRNQEYLEARLEYLQVSEGDSLYSAAQEKIPACIEAYAAQTVEAAEKEAVSGNYPSAIRVLETGNTALEDLDTFSPDIDAALETCLADYEKQLLEEAARLSDFQENQAAAELILGGIENYDMDSEAMLAALEQYSAYARTDVIAAARQRAEALRDAGDEAAAFAEMDALSELLDGDTADAEAAVIEYEQDYAAEKIKAAAELFANSRETLPDAVLLLDTAIEIRDLPELEAYREELAQYLPLSLESADTAGETIGTVFRTKTVFESMDGTKYSDGWIWGENEAEITFALDGQFDVFSADFAMRRDDNKNANSYFVIYADGEQLFKSETLHHWETKILPITVDISGCNEMKIVFYNDYEVKTAEDGYCYHGLCSPMVMKDLPAA